MKRHILALFFTLLPSFIAAQEDSDTFLDVYNSLSDLDDFDEEGWTEAYDNLTAMALTPQNINAATYEDLTAVPLLTEEQALAILYYRSLYGDLRSISELSLITAIDPPRCKILSSIFYAEPISGSTKGILKSPRSSLVMTLSVPTYKRKGFITGKYLGDRFSHSIRYQMKTNRLHIGLTAAKDAGEPFFRGTNRKGWDFYTGFVRLKDTGIMKDIIIGHYQVSTGMGLIINNGYRLSKTSLLTTQPSSATKLRGHTSKQENNYLQGIASTFELWHGNATRNLSLTAFLSWKSIDAKMSDTEPKTISTIISNGYHRTETEIGQRNATGQTVAGGSLIYTSLPFRIGLNVLHTHLGDSLVPSKKQMYRRYYPEGKDFTDGSISYSFMTPQLQFSGETALGRASTYNDNDKEGISVATANAIRWNFHSLWTAFALQRYYSYRHTSLLGRSFGDVSNCQNENGLYAGMTTTAIRNLTLSAYLDCAYHPWIRYGYDNSSRSWDTYLLATYERKSLSAAIRYRYREQAVTDNGSIFPQFGSHTDGTAQHTLRSTLKCSFGRFVSSSQLQGTFLPTSDDWGWLLSEGLGYQTARLSLWLSIAYFHTSDYISRLYMTDRSITYGATSSMVYGHGIRANILAKATITGGLQASVRCNFLHYFDRDRISSANQLIDSSSQTDLYFQLNWKF
ncbi:MAG: helix-hairpin-helix domain-containing protein [Bacteroidales bacterium]|nr:helix-hairpin-helix domain-containing protein [Bacteroidales bacterium]MCM1147813.1 helix-hairpin-helix domain-containing protein [Bacteroidales bacterium]MCM1206461.1 helix-hairpin-helix domain-containing protein [Bacillota bacterium]MCM1510346.1 helix-hairpin-helix domain-containing protein [Clostridium sp.]